MTQRRNKAQVLATNQAGNWSCSLNVAFHRCSFADLLLVLKLYKLIGPRMKYVLAAYAEYQFMLLRNCDRDDLLLISISWAVISGKSLAHS
jgi:hypothetical protein